LNIPDSWKKQLADDPAGILKQITLAYVYDVRPDNRKTIANALQRILQEGIPIMGFSFPKAL
jgi:hypothetical protein